MEEEFDALWKDSYPLPDAIIEEIQRVAERVEIRFDKVSPAELPGAALAESPIYRGGEQLQPWQRAFVTMFLKHRETYGKARMLCGRGFECVRKSAWTPAWPDSSAGCFHHRSSGNSRPRRRW